MAPSLRRPWLRCIRTPRFLTCRLDDSHHGSPHARHPSAHVDHARGLRRRASRPRLLGCVCIPLHRRTARRRRHDVHDRARQRLVLRGDRAARALGRRSRPRRDHRRRRSVLAEAHQRRAAPLARAREGCHPPRDRRARERGVGSTRARRGQAPVASRLRPHARGVRREHRLPLPHRRARPRRSRRDVARARADARRTRGRARTRRLSGVPHVGGLARLRRSEGARALPRRARRRVALVQDQGRPSISRATCGGAR